jgi:hypothetical protein
MNEKIDTLRTLAGLFERRDDAMGLVVGCGGHLGQLQAAIGGVMQNQIRKRAADITADNNRTHDQLSPAILQ